MIRSYQIIEDAQVLTSPPTADILTARGQIRKYKWKRSHFSLYTELKLLQLNYVSSFPGRWKLSMQHKYELHVSLSGSAEKYLTLLLLSKTELLPLILGM